MEMKIKLYLWITLLINYVTEENIFVNVEISLCKACSFTVFCQKKFHQKKKKDKKRVTPGCTDISSPGHVSFLSGISMHYIMLTLHNPRNSLNVVSTNNFSWVSNFTSPSTWCTIKLRRLEIDQLSIPVKIRLFSLPLVKSK